MVFTLLILTQIAIIVITSLNLCSSSCLGQETTKGPSDLRVKLPPAHMFTTHDEGFILFLLIAECHAETLRIPVFLVFGLIRRGMEPESTLSVADAPHQAVSSSSWISPSVPWGGE